MRLSGGKKITLFGTGFRKIDYLSSGDLGNVRVAFTDRNGDKRIQLLDGEAGPSEVTQINDYFSLGLQFPRACGVGVVPENRYKFNGIEHIAELELDLAAFRSYDAAIGRWMQVDPLAEAMPSMTPYRFGFNNPLSWSDPWGLFETRREAREYKREEKVKGRIRKQEDGSFGIVDKKNHSITTNDSELGVVTATYVAASGNKTITEKFTSIGGWIPLYDDIRTHGFSNLGDNPERRGQEDFDNRRIFSVPEPIGGAGALGYIGPGGVGFFKNLLKGLSNGRVKAGTKYVGQKSFLEYYKELYRNGFRRVSKSSDPGSTQKMVNSQTGETVYIRQSGPKSGNYSGYDTFFQPKGAGKSDILFIPK